MKDADGYQRHEAYLRAARVDHPSAVGRRLTGSQREPDAPQEVGEARV